MRNYFSGVITVGAPYISMYLIIILKCYIMMVTKTKFLYGIHIFPMDARYKIHGTNGRKTPVVVDDKSFARSIKSRQKVWSEDASHGRGKKRVGRIT